MTAIGPDEFRFFVLNKKSDWDEGVDRKNIEITEEGIELKRVSAYAAGRTIKSRAFRDGITVADFAVGDCDLLYILDGSGLAILIYDPNQARFERVDTVKEWVSSPTSIAFAPGTLYVGDNQAEQRIAAVASINWQIRWTIGAGQDATGKALPLESPFEPADLAVDGDGNLYALDQTNLAIVKFDQAGRLVAVIGREALQATDPVTIALSPDGFLYVLDVRGNQVLSFEANAPFDARQLVDFQALIGDGQLPREFTPSCLAVDAQGQLYIGENRTIPEGEEDDRFLREFARSGEYVGVVLAYRGCVKQLVVDAADRIAIFNNEEREIVILKAEPTLLRPGEPLPPAGLYVSRALDSTSTGTRWHKLVLDAEIPENTQIQVSYLISDEEKSPAELKALPESAWSIPLVNPHDALIRSPTGRYLWLRLSLIGSEQATPAVRSIRVYAPRLSYLRYLPAVYQENERSRDFLERFLALYETLFSGLEGQIDDIVRYFDADAVSGDFLRWLGAWLAIADDENWPEEKRRTLLKRAPQIYRKRGTREGLEEMIEICTGERPLIVEQFQLDCAQNQEIQDILARLHGTDPYCFSVLLKPSQANSEGVRRTVRYIIDAEKPANTCAGMLALEPRIHLNMHTYLGLNTHLSQPTLRLDVGAAMAHGTVLTDIDEAGQVERRSRLGLDTELT